jgi:tetratricopeptide (TPR) repeat protein
VSVYSSRDVAGLFGLKPARVRALARAGILSPSRGPRAEYRFDFQDLVLLRSARALAQAEVPQRTVSRTLRRLVQQLPPGRRPSEVRLAAEAGRVLASDGEITWMPENGQVVMDLFPEPGAPVAAFSPLGLGGSPAEEWYQHGLDLESGGDVEGARAAYAKALELDAAHPGARVNLGRLVQQHSPLEAITHYRAALAVVPKNATAAFNLGTALEAIGQQEEAIAAYRLALQGNPALADAHHNLALLYQRTGHKLAAMVHLKRYRELTN